MRGVFRLGDYLRMLLNIRAADVPLLIRKTAKEMAGAFYELDRTPQFRAQAGSQKRFIRDHWKDHIGIAIEALVTLMGQKGTSEHVKAEIYEAIIEWRERSKQGTPKPTTRTLQ